MICYLLQNIDFDFWIYNFFKITLSLEQTYLYQLNIKMGIVAESLATTLLLQPILKKENELKTQGSPKSIGLSLDTLSTAHEIEVQDKHVNLKDKILKNKFSDNLKLIQNLSILKQEQVDLYYSLKEIRNLVHIQNWEGTLFNNLTVESFKKDISRFKELLLSIKEYNNLSHSIENLFEYFNNITKDSINYESSEEYKGEIINYYSQKGFGFIKSSMLEQNVFFHITNIITGENILDDLIGMNVSFYTSKKEKGLEAKNIRVF